MAHKRKEYHIGSLKAERPLTEHQLPRRYHVSGRHHSSDNVEDEIEGGRES